MMRTWCSKHVESWNKVIVKQKFCASIWLITKINKHGVFTASFPLRTAIIKKENHNFKYGITTISLFAVIAISTKTFIIYVIHDMPLVSRLIDTRPARAKKEETNGQVYISVPMTALTYWKLSWLAQNVQPEGSKPRMTPANPHIHICRIFSIRCAHLQDVSIWVSFSKNCNAKIRLTNNLYTAIGIFNVSRFRMTLLHSNKSWGPSTA